MSRGRSTTTTTSTPIPLQSRRILFAKPRPRRNSLEIEIEGDCRCEKCKGKHAAESGRPRGQQGSASEGCGMVMVASCGSRCDELLPAKNAAGELDETMEEANYINYQMTTSDARTIGRRRRRSNEEEEKVSFRLNKFAINHQVIKMTHLCSFLLVATLATILTFASSLQAEALTQQQQQQATIAGLQQSMAQLLQVFNGGLGNSLGGQNGSSITATQQEALEANHFKLMEREGDFLLLGARNVVYNLSLSSMREQRRLEWFSSEDDVRMCRVKGKREEQCQNYIRVLKLQAPDSLLVCGTNAYKPRCRTYMVTADSYELVSETPGEGVCPYQENQNVTSVFTDGHLYSATATQFSGIDGLIHRAPLRTEQFNPKQLNSPNFVSSFRYGDHVYFLFRETAIEHINCGKVIYSRIARVCLNDSGGPSRASRERWTSFVKARLNCSIPGEFPFYFDEIQASTGVISAAGSSAYQTAPQSDLLYAVFTTPTNSIGGSAVCAFRMSDVLAAFDGPFKAQADSNSNWLPVPESRVPQPRPGTCVNDSKQLLDEKINFIKDNPLMDQAVEAVWSQPLIMMASINFRFTQVAVDAQVESLGAPGGQHMRTDVIFVATDDGRVFKLINTHHLHGSSANQRASALNSYTSAPYYSPLASRPIASAQVASGQATTVTKEPPPDISGQTVVIEELHLFDSRTPIVNLMIHYSSAGLSEAYPKLLVLSSKQLKAIPLSRCERALTCQDCLALYDPYCVWDARQQACQSVGRSALTAKSSNYLTMRHLASSQAAWFPPNNNNSQSLGWWHQCAVQQDSPSAHQVVSAPFKSMFSSHLQVPSRFDYQSNHHLAHTALVALNTQQQHYRQPPASECLTYCGGLYTPLAPQQQQQQQPEQLMMNCADLVQQHYIGGLPSGSGFGSGNHQQQSPNQQNLYTSENLYFAVIICAVAGLVLGLVFGFAIGRNTKKHDSSICSSTFDETNLYMASTGSNHHGHHVASNLFAHHQQRLAQHPLLQQTNGIRPLNQQLNQASNQQQHLFEANQCLLPLNSATNDSAVASNYGNQPQMLLHVAANGSTRSGALPPLPSQTTPLVNTTNTNSSTQINHSQLTPNSLSAASSTNTSSTSATVPANDNNLHLNHHQLYLNQQQAQQQQQHQRSFTNGSNNSAVNNNNTTTGSSMKGKGSSFLQPSTQLQQQQNNKIYL